MPHTTCPRQNELRHATTAALSKIESLASEQLKALQFGQDSKMAALDKQIELAFGEKERAFGALRAHREEHRC